MKDLMRWGIDMSFGVTIASHWQEMVDNGLSFAIFRAGQGFGTGDDLDSIRPQCETAIHYGVPFGLYWAIKPWYAVKPQVARFLAASANFSAKCLCLDAELYQGATPEQCNQHYLDAYNALKAGTKLPVVNYSAKWCISEYYPEMTSWIGRDVFWGADYYAYHFAPVTWQDFHRQIAEIVMPVYAGYPPLGIYQMAGNWPTPMVPHKIDYDMIREDVWHCCFNDGPRPAYLDAVPPVTPPVQTQPYLVNNETGLYVRSAPDANSAKLRWLADSTLLAVVSKLNGWAQIALPLAGYVSEKYIKPVVK